MSRESALAPKPIESQMFVVPWAIPGMIGGWEGLTRSQTSEARSFDRLWGTPS